MPNRAWCGLLPKRAGGEVMSKLQSEYDLLRDYSRELEEEVASLKTDRINFIRMNERLKEMIIKCEIEVRELRYDTEPPPR
jgi:hypothetical protein